jgi:essential nuclear protein 1
VQAQRFVNIVLLPHVRRDIRDNRRLHFALFQSLKKACYKPDAFYKVHSYHWPPAACCELCS